MFSTTSNGSGSSNPHTPGGGLDVLYGAPGIPQGMMGPNGEFKPSNDWASAAAAAAAANVNANAGHHHHHNPYGPQGMIPTHGHVPQGMNHGHGHGLGHVHHAAFGGLHHPFDDAASTHSSASTGTGNAASAAVVDTSASPRSLVNGGGSPLSSVGVSVGGGGRSRAGSMVESVAAKGTPPMSVGGMGGNPVMSMFF